MQDSIKEARLVLIIQKGSKDSWPPSRCLEMRVILLLLSMRVLSRGSFGKPSRMITLLSERSILSNWFCDEDAPHSRAD